MLCSAREYTWAMCYKNDMPSCVECTLLLKLSPVDSALLVYDKDPAAVAEILMCCNGIV